MITTFLFAIITVVCIIITLILWEILKELARVSGVILVLSKSVCKRKEGE